MIKNGIQLPVDERVRLFSYDHVILGRQPATRLHPDRSAGSTATLLHPSVSRAHAVLVFGPGPNQSSEPAGWHLCDLGSTHGTFVNKHRLPTDRFVRLHVGYVLRFGASTRLLVLHGPDSDVEPETPETWSELVAKRRAKLERLEHEPPKPEIGSGGGACNWGMDEEAEEPGTQQLLQSLHDSAACLNHEQMYAEDPKKALRAYFEREGIEPAPEYEFVEGKFGQQMCRIE